MKGPQGKVSEAHTQIGKCGLFPRAVGMDMSALLTPDLGLVMITDF